MRLSIRAGKTGGLQRRRWRENGVHRSRYFLPHGGQDEVRPALRRGDGLPPCRLVYTIATYVNRAPKFDWDESNTGHIALHDVTAEEVEQAFANDPLVVLAVQKRSEEERVLCAGLTDEGRPGQY